jgi:hypothetical protein
LKCRRQLNGIVVDEWHVILKMEARFGPKLCEMSALARADIQMVMLRGTLPRCREMLLWKGMSWRADEVKMFRMAKGGKTFSIQW